MPKLFFWTNYYIEKEDVGTTVKIRNEIKTLRDMGYDVHYTAYNKNGVAIYNNQDKKTLYLNYKMKNEKIISLTKKDYLINISRLYLKQEVFDFFLIRINFFSKSYVSMLKEMNNQNGLIMMETLSYFPNMKYNIFKYPKLFLVDFSLKFNIKKIFKYVNIMLTEGIIDNYYGIPCIEFGMGVNVDEYSLHDYKGDKNILNLLMVGCTSIYHGTDRIINSLEEYYRDDTNNKIINLHLVGDILDSDKKKINNKLINQYIYCYGRKSGKELEEIYDKCNIALGPLAQYRLQKKDTGLKTKEYFAKGIPYVYTGEEYYFKEDYPYICQIPNDESLIDFNMIWDFYESINDDLEIGVNMRNVARDIFNWENIFLNVFNKLSENNSKSVG